MKWKFPAVLVTMLVVVGAIATLMPPSGVNDWGESELRTFVSYDEFKDYLETGQDYSEKEGGRVSDSSLGVTTANEGTAAPSGSPDHSTTNIQVEGVDEGDIVKNDGKYAYIVSKNQTKVYILDIFPAEQAKILSIIEMDFQIQEIYISGDKLVILGGGGYWYYHGEIDYVKGGEYLGFQVHVYDITNRENPQLDREVEIDGNYITSRLIGDYLYVIVTMPTYQIKEEDDLPVPATQIYFTGDYDYSYSLTNVISVNVQNPEEETKEMVVLLSYSHMIFVSNKNIYITHTRTKYSKNPGLFFSFYEPSEQKTAIHRIAIKNGNIKYINSGEVPGRPLNRFSMDEYDNHFRIATTTGQVWSSGSDTAKNHVFILNMDMVIVGVLKDIAPGERIYSARFMGDRGYLVTFKKVDPFFVLDLSNPTDPEILGELKIPGYSNYLHPYDEDHVIGIGKDTVDMGSFAWYQGVKLSFFDVTDVNDPKELSKFIIGDRGTQSLALSDPHAFLFEKNKNLLVIPIRLAEIDDSKYPGGAPPQTHGDFVWAGVYVFHISSENGIELAERITHWDDFDPQSNSWYYSYNYQIKRSFYIDDVLYTVSNNMIKANSLNDFAELNSLELAD